MNTCIPHHPHVLSFRQQFNDKHLLLIETTNASVDDHSIRCVGHLVDRIMFSDLSGGAESWLWTATGTYLPEALRPSDGRAGSLEEVKVAFRSKFDAWLTWAMEQGGPVPWNGPRV